MHRSARTMPQTTDCMVFDWWTQCRMTVTFANACSDINNKSRRRVDVFLVESVLFEHVLRQSERQLLVPAPVVVAKYMTAWSYRPASTWVLRQLTALEQHKYTRHNWIRHFRQKWGISWGLLPAGQNVTMSEMKAKVVPMDRMQCGHGIEHRARYAYLVCVSVQWTDATHRILIENSAGRHLGSLVAMAVAQALGKLTGGRAEHGRDHSASFL
jgi:hypothetical protein